MLILQQIDRGSGFQPLLEPAKPVLRIEDERAAALSCFLVVCRQSGGRASALPAEHRQSRCSAIESLQAVFRWEHQFAVKWHFQAVQPENAHFTAAN